MNKIYKSIWNHVTRTFTAVSEGKTDNRKSPRLKGAVVFSLFLGAVLSSPVMGYDSGEQIIGGQDFYIGGSKVAQSEVSTNLPGNNTLVLSFAEANLDSGTLFALSSTVYEQAVFETSSLRNWSALLNNSFTVGHELQSNNSITQRQAGVATLTFAIGEEASKLLWDNKDSYESDNVEFNEGFGLLLVTQYE